MAEALPSATHVRPQHALTSRGENRGRNSFSICPTSTAKTDEVRALLDEMLASLNLSSSRRNGEFLVNPLKALCSPLSPRAGERWAAPAGSASRPPNHSIASSRSRSTNPRELRSRFALGESGRHWGDAVDERRPSLERTHRSRLVVGNLRRRWRCPIAVADE